MKFQLALLLLPWLVLGAASRAEAPKPNPNAEAEGRALVAQLLAQEPAQNLTNHGVLNIRPGRGKGPTRETPVGFRLFSGAGEWRSVYETAPTNQTAAVRLTVIRKANGANEYHLAEAANSVALETGGKILADAEVMTPFAGSDFWAADLGLEFLHWPTQRLLTKEMTRGQSCNVLESLAPSGQTNGYVRVKSWLDIDTGGVVYAEAYDAKGALVKEFAPKGVKKVEGRWELEEMQINNRQTGSRTRLRFDFGSD